MNRTIVFACAGLTVALVAALAVQDYAHFPYSDGSEQGAAVRALADDMTDPGDPIVNETVPSSRYVPSTLLMALFVKIFDVDTITALKIFTCIFCCFFLMCAYLFCRAYFDDPRIPPLCIAALLFLWGTGWMGSNAYMFSALAYNAYFSSVVAFGLSMLALCLQINFLTTNSWKQFAAGTATGALAFVNHPLTGSFFLIGSFLIFIEYNGMTLKAVMRFILFAVPSLVFMACWPYYDFFSSFRRVASGGMSHNIDFTMTWTYLHSQPLIRLGPALAGIPLLVVLARQRRYLFLTGGFVVFITIYVAGYFAHFSLSERFIFFVAFVLQLTCALFIRRWFDSPYTWHILAARIMALLIGVGAACQAGLVYKEFIRPAWRFTDASLVPQYESPNRIQREWRMYFKRGDVVLSDIWSSFPIPVYTGARVVAAWQTSPHAASTAERLRDVALFYNQNADDETRIHILKKYGVSHILIHYAIGGKDLEPSVRRLNVSEVACTQTYAIFKCTR